MSDFVSNATPPLIPGDSAFRNVTATKAVNVTSLFVLPKITTATLPTTAVGSIMFNTSTNKVMAMSTSLTWLTVTST